MSNLLFFPLVDGSEIGLGEIGLVCGQVMGNDLAITIAGPSGTLELNVMIPLIAFDLPQSIEIEANAARLFAEKCTAGIIANRKRCESFGQRSYALAAAIASSMATIALHR